MNVNAPLRGRTVLVTGSSRGIGKATVEALHRDGAKVAIHYGHSSGHAEAMAEKMGERASLIGVDLMAEDGPWRLWDEAVSRFGRIDVLVNNAGAWIASEIEDESAWAKSWEDNLRLNLTSAADLCRLAIHHYRRCGGGIIVNVTSRSAHRGDDAEHLAYGAAKGGLLALTKGIARGYGREGVLAYAIAPGWVLTDLAKEAHWSDDPTISLPLGEITPPEDVAEVIAFLASGRARHATGCTIDITGADYVR